VKINALDYLKRETHRDKGCTVTTRTDARCETCKVFDALVGWHPTTYDRKFLKQLRIDPA
jgi:hypothetical protein